MYSYTNIRESLRVLYEHNYPEPFEPFKHFKHSVHSVHSEHSEHSNRFKRVKHFEYVGSFPSLKEIDFNALECMGR